MLNIRFPPSDLHVDLRRMLKNLPKINKLSKTNDSPVDVLIDEICIPGLLVDIADENGHVNWHDYDRNTKRSHVDVMPMIYPPKSVVVNVTVNGYFHAIARKKCDKLDIYRSNHKEEKVQNCHDSISAAISATITSSGNVDSSHPKITKFNSSARGNIYYFTIDFESCISPHAELDWVIVGRQFEQSRLSITSS